MSSGNVTVELTKDEAALAVDALRFYSNHMAEKARHHDFETEFDEFFETLGAAKAKISTARFQPIPTGDHSPEEKHDD